MNEMYNGITPMRLHTTPIIPLTYGDALSYMETLAKVTHKLNEVITKVNGIQVDILEDSKVYTDEAIKLVFEDVNRAFSEVESMKNELDSKYASFVNLVNSRINLFRGELDVIEDNLETGIIGANNYTNVAIEHNNELLMLELSKGLNNVKVNNYFTGQLTTVQEMFNYLAQFHLTNAITFTQLMAKNKTYDNLTNAGYNYTELALNGAGMF